MNPIAVIGSLCLLLATVSAIGAECAAWNTRGFFETAAAQVVSHCLQAGADSRARDELGLTPYACGGCVQPKPAVIATLLAAGAGLNAPANDGMPPPAWSGPVHRRTRECESRLVAPGVQDAYVPVPTAPPANKFRICAIFCSAARIYKL